MGWLPKGSQLRSYGIKNMAIQSAIMELNKRTARAVVMAYKEMVRSMIDFAGRSYSSLKHPRGGRSAQSRLNDSGKFANKWVVIDEVSSREISIKTNDSIHSDNVTYSDIVAYNDKNSNRVNRNIDNPPELTPSSEKQIEKQIWFTDYVTELGEILDKECSDVPKIIEIKI